MSLISTFYAGAAPEIATAVRERPATADAEFASVDLGVRITDTSGLFADQIDAACRELARMRGKRPVGMKRFIAEVLDGDGEEAQVVRLAPAFVKAFAALTEPETSELSRRLADREAEQDREFRERMLQLASRPIQSKFDYVALVIVPLFTWGFMRRAGAGSTPSVLVAVAVGGAFVALTFLVLPWVRRRKIPAEKPSSLDYTRALAALAGLCRKAERERLDLVYEWSL
jgi:hypothetical protein